MNILSGTSRHVPTVVAYRVRRGIDELAMLGAATFGALVIAFFALGSPYPGFSVAATLYMVGVAVILAKPRMGAYLLIFLAVVGEPETMPWYPFNKNGSSAESILFVDDRLVASPYEGYILITLVAILLHRFRSGEPLRVATPYTMPLLLLAGAIFLALAWGVVTGGTVSIAINQTRMLLVLPFVYLIMINLLDRRTIRTALWVLLWAIVVESGFVLHHIFFALSSGERATLFDSGASPVTHSSAVQYNLVLFGLAAVALLRNSRLTLRLLLPVFAIPVGTVYVIAECRAAVGALLIAAALLMYVLARRQPGRFWLVAPTAGTFFAAYCAAFWNSTSSAAFPVQAIKGQVVDDSGTTDAASDLYRVIENFNLLATVQTNPLLGTGFGKPFLTPIPLPDISSAFALWQFFPHNSLLQLWASGGILSLAAYLYLAYAGVRGGTKASLEAKDPWDVIMAMVGMAAVVMVTIYSYFDISFDNQTMMLFTLGLVFIALVQRGIDDDAEAEAGSEDPSSGVDLRDSASHSRRQRRHVGV